MSTHARKDPPSVYDYLDHRAFLADWFAWKKATNPRYSHRAFSRAVGSRNPSLFLLISQGKRNISASMLPRLVAALKLTAAESTFLRHLIDLEQATDDAQRNEVWDKLSATRRFREARTVEADGFDYLSHWYIPATRELAALPDFRLDAAWIAARLRPAITSRQAQRAIDVLLSLSLLQPTEDGGATRTDASVVTPHEVTRLAVVNYHSGMIDLGRESLTRHTGAERHIGAVTAAIPIALLPTLKDEIAAFQERILDLCDRADPGSADAVFQFNMQLFPLSTVPTQES